MLTSFRTIARVLRERRDRSVAIRALSALNDHQLSDIGIERGAIVNAVSGQGYGVTSLRT